ncbi:MAG: hypothetical protein U0075_25785 [Thermomicrobiales bacterium]
MVGAPQFTSSLAEATRQCSAGSAAALARAYLDYVSGVWLGEADATSFGERLATCWGFDLPPEPARAADAFSPHGGGGRGIRWYECGHDVLGYIPDCTSGYRIPLTRIAEFSPSARGNPQHPAGMIANRVQPGRTDEGETPRHPALVAAAHSLPERPTVMGARS